MTRRSRLAILIGGAMVVAAGCSSTATRTKGPVPGGQQPWAPPRRLEAPESLPPVARDILKRRMARHADDMTHLVLAVAALDYGSVGDLAERIAGDADFARPLTDDATELNASIPARFFDLQDDLKAKSRRLAAAARAGDPIEISRAYASLSDTCIGCHAVYRDGPGYDRGTTSTR
jgi:cytochrome c556